MFKFAANKLSGSGAAGAGSANTNSTKLGEANSPPSAAVDSNASTRRRCQIQKDLFAFNKIADKGFPSKPSAMDFDRKLKLLAIGTKNGDIRIYGEPNTLHQQLSCYQDVHPFPILRLLFVQGQHQLITLSERTYRNDMTNKGETNLFLVLWQIPSITQLEHSNSAGSNLIEKVKEYQIEPKIVNNTRLSALSLLNDNSHLFIGFESGDVYVFNVGTFQMVPGVINKDYILKNLPATTSSDQKKLTTLGAVESICHHPRLLTKLLIAYQRGLWIIFDFIKNQIEQINQTQQQLESAVFYQHGECVATAHSDGSFILWDLSASTTGADQPTTSAPVTTPTTCSSSSAPNIVYGPYPCKAVNKCMVKTCRSDQPYVIFSGGCPRVNYSDKITITVIQGEQSHVCFDFTSKIIEFFTVDKPSVEKIPSGTATGATSIVYDNPQALFVLLEEEFVAIDLVSDQWPQYKLPYLCSVHSSAIICTHYASNVSRSFYEKLVKYGSSGTPLEPGEIYSERDWPISTSSGNHSLTSKSDTKDLLLTGHEDGSVRFWDVTNMSMTLLYRLKTSDYFQTDSTPMSGSESDPAAEVDNWPPFRKVGTFDPYSDDPKLGVQKIYLCPRREIIVIAGTAGQVLLMTLNDQAVELPFANINAHKLNIIGSSPEVESHFVWKGHEALLTRGRFDEKPTSSPAKIEGSMKVTPGYQLHTLIQLYPPATVSALALNTDWQLIGMGTSHGFALFDYNSGKELLIRCTLDPAMVLAANNPTDSAGGTSATISRRKSLKKSLRESFRKLRRGRSQKPGAKKTVPGSEVATAKQLADDDMSDAAMHRPIERQVESREFKPVDDIPPSVIRYIYFVRTHITSNQQQTNSMWVGTNTGIIYIYALQFMINTASVSSPKPAIGMNVAPNTTGTGTLRTNQAINCLLAKEMRLKHRAPVVHIQVIDQNMQPLPLDDAVSSADAQNGVGPSNHKVIICSEEQFKVFQLPTLKPVCKFKLTAVEGARVRRIGYTNYVSRQDARYHEYCLSCLSNLGDISVYSLPSLKRQVQIQCMKQQDINAITSFVFSKQGQAFYLQSASEFVHISMSARDSPPTHFHAPQIKQQQAITNSPLKETRTVSKKPSQEKQANSDTNPTESNSAANVSQAAAVSSTLADQEISSPKSAPPPVPAPRTTISNSQSKDDTNRVLCESTSKPLNTSIPEPGKVENPGTECDSSTKSADLEAPAKKETPISPVKTRQLATIQASPTDDNKPDLANTSIVMSASAGMQSTSTLAGLNQSMSNGTVANTTLSNGAPNCSMSTAQSDSFNVSSSGYNGSSSCNTFNLSMDSVVDKFTDEFSQLVVNKKIPSSIDEDPNGVETDSLLNESNPNPTPTSTKLTNGHHKLVKTNGHDKQTNGTENGHTNNGANLIDEEPTNTTIEIAGPQKASSPLAKIPNGQNGHILPLNIEQVTKRIENGNKLEYRETAID